MKKNLDSTTKLKLILLFSLLNIKLTICLGVISPKNLYRITPDDKLESYSIDPSDIKVEKATVKRPDQEPGFEYKITYTPKERLDLIIKENSNLELVEKGDLMLMVGKGKEISIGQTHVLDEDLDETQIGEIAEAEIQKSGDKARIGKINMHNYQEMKWIPLEFRVEIFNHWRVMSYIQSEYNSEYFLDFANQQNAIVDYDTMVKRYLDRFNQLLINILVPLYSKLIDKMHDDNPLENDKYMQFMRSHPVENLKQNINEMLEPYQEEIEQNNLLLATLHKYYNEEIQDIVQGGKIKELLLARLKDHERNLCLDAAIIALNKRNNGQKISFDSPWGYKQEPINPIYIQLIMKEKLIDMAGDAMIANLLGSEEGVVHRSYEEKAESTAPVDKFDIIIYHLITRIHEGFKKHIAKLGVPPEIELHDITEKFVESANFNKFLIKMIMENSGQSLAQFIQTYTTVTIKRTFTDDIFFGLDEGKFILNIKTLENYLDLLGENMVQANRGSYMVVIGDGGEQLVSDDIPIDVNGSKNAEELALDMDTPDHDKTDTLSSLERESEKSNKQVVVNNSEIKNDIDLDDKTPINLL